MGATFTIPLVTVIPGQLITAALWNAEFENMDANWTPAGMDDYSATDVEMQIQTAPFPGSVLSRPTSMAGELERMRYQLDLIIGQTYWYQGPSVDLEQLSTHDHSDYGAQVVTAGIADDAVTRDKIADEILADLFESTTALIFPQAAAPLGWTKSTTHNGKALRIVSGSGGGSGGTSDIADTITLAHTHTVNSHVHDISGHRHVTPVAAFGAVTIGSSVDWGPAEGYETLSRDYWSAAGSNLTASLNWLKTRTSDTVNTGGTAPATNSKLTNLSLAYVDAIICVKD